MTPHRALAPYDWSALLALIRAEFSGMEGRIDPPSSMHRLTAETIAEQATKAEVWVIGTPPRACVFLTPQADALYIGKLAVRADQRRLGLARALLTCAESRARALGLSVLELDTRVELVENHATFRALGFTEVGRKSHAGFTRATSITFRKPVPEA
jgi:ribosomal protein S18 acetylase RimI-like enzyme